MKRERGRLKATQLYQCIYFGIIACLCSLALSTFLYIGLKDLRYSTFYIPRTQEVIAELHEKRVSEAQKYLSQLDESDTSTFVTDRIHLCIGIPSVDRSPHKYLTINIASLLRGLSKKEKERFGVKVFILDTDSFNSSRNLEVKELKGKFPHLFEVVDSTVTPDQYDEWFQKETLDYAQMMRICAKVKPTMAIILEDDVIATNHYVAKFWENLLKIPEGANYMDIKLFYPDFYCGFDSMDKLLIVLLSGLVSFFLTKIVSRLIDSKFQTQFTSRLIFVYLLVLGVIIPIVVGKQNFTHGCFKNGVQPFTATACTSAVAYHLTKLEFLAKHLETNYRLDPIDLVLDRLAQKFNYSRYIFVPNLFQHIGIFSSAEYKNQGDDYHYKMSMNFVDD